MNYHNQLQCKTDYVLFNVSEYRDNAGTHLGETGNLQLW